MGSKLPTHRTQGAATHRTRSMYIRGLITLAVLTGCSKPSPSWIDVSPLRGTSELAGPYQISATSSPGRGEHQAWIRLGFSPFDHAGSGCEDLADENALVANTRGCVSIAMHRRGNRWRGEFTLDMVPPRTTVGTLKNVRRERTGTVHTHTCGKKSRGRL